MRGKIYETGRSLKSKRVPANLGAVTSGAAAETVLRVNGHELRHAVTFSSVKAGQAFWYENSNGLVELAVNRGRADVRLGVEVGSPVVL